jgi:RNA polymerase sigma-70 factor (ECF subfamily)
MQLECKPEQTLACEYRTETLRLSVNEGGLPHSDEELVIAAQNGESCALGELLSRHQKMLFRVARRYTANADEAHDLVQEAMLRAIRSIGRFRGESRFVHWLNTIVINTALSQKRREKRIQLVNIDEHDEEDTRFCVRSLRDGRRNPEEDYSHRETRALLRREALKLPPKYRYILKACDLDDSSIKEVAQSLGLHLGAAKSRLFRARWSLSVAIKRSGAIRSSAITERQRV